MLHTRMAHNIGLHNIVITEIIFNSSWLMWLMSECEKIKSELEINRTQKNTQFHTKTESACLVSSILFV